MAAFEELGVSIAWHVANFSKAGKLPSLKSVLDKMRQKVVKPSKAQQKAMVHQIAAQFGLPVHFVPKKQDG